MTTQAAQATPILTIDDVSIKFGSFIAVEKVSTSVGRNEIRFFIGPNGAGKTTLLDAICGKNKICEGRILYDGEVDVSKLRENKLANLGIGRKFQAPSIFPGITIHENMELAAAQRRSLYSAAFEKLSKEKSESISHILNFIGLWEQKFEYPSVLSHGEKQWLEIGMLLASKPKLLMLDEPVAGMGRRETERTQELLSQIKNDCSIIIVEHDMQFARALSDSVTVLHEGRVLDEGTMESVQQNQQVIDVYLGRGGETAC